MTKRVCATPRCPTLVEQGARGGRCPACERKHDRARGTSAERGYDAAHRSERARLQTYMDAGVEYTCWRCHKPIDPRHWHLGHCDLDRSRHHGPEHVACNDATRGRTGCPHPSHAATHPGG